MADLSKELNKELSKDFAYCEDTISRQAAIDALKNRWKKTRNYEGIGDDIAEECELYLKQVPSAQPEWHESPKNALYIRKADAIEICMEQIESPINTYFEKGTAEIIKEKITELPSVQTEIIRCKDCKYFELDHFEKVDEFPIPIIVAHEICMKWSGGCRTSIDGWCFMAERRTDETD